MKTEDLSLRPWTELDKEELCGIRDDLWTAQALNRAAYKALEDKACAGSVPDIEEQADIMQLLKAAGEYMQRTESAMNRFI